MNDVILFDLDGTLCDNRHRQHFLEKTPKDWKAFLDNCIHDDVFDYVLKLYNILKTSNHEMLLCSCRPETIRKQTEWWLSEVAKISYSELIMRPENDSRPDTVVKYEMLKELRLRNKNIVFAVDDRPDVVYMWRNNRVPCFQVDDSMWIHRA